MGHERVGALPRTQKWLLIVEGIAGSENQGVLAVGEIARRTIDNVRTRYSRIHEDQGVQAAFAYLVCLAASHLPRSEGLSSADINLEENPSPVRLAQQLGSWVRRQGGSQEYAEIAYRAGADTIASWTQEHSKQGQLFEPRDTAYSIWSKAANARGFCEMARLFFAYFTERYLRYFLEREASAMLPSLVTREQFSENLHSHVSNISKHAFETSKITQSFAAGWFNNHAQYARPSDKEIKGFLAIAFGKIQEELQRESLP